MKANRTTTNRADKFSIVVWKNIAVKNMALNDNKMIITATEVVATYLNRLWLPRDESADNSKEAT